MNKFGLTIVIVAVVVACVSAEAPRFRQNSRRFFARQELQPTTTAQPGYVDAAPYAPSGWKPAGERLVYPSRLEVTTTTDLPTTTDAEESTTVESGPYAPSGWKPAGERLVLPARQQEEPKTKYGTPETDDSAEASGESNIPPVNPDAEELDLGAKSNEQAGNVGATQSPQSQQQQGAYFVQLPDGSIQRVVYLTSADLATQEVTARLQVQPIDVSAAQPIQLINPVLVPKFVSYSSQYQSW